MKTAVKVIISTIMVLASLNAFASDFCDGFEMGYTTVKGNNVMVQMCPMEPMTPMASTPYQEGIKAGMQAAEKKR